MPYNGWLWPARLPKTKESPSSLGNLGAAKEVFGLVDEEFNYVFTPDYEIDNNYNENYERVMPCSPGEDATAKQIAKHICRFVKYKYDSKK